MAECDRFQTWRGSAHDVSACAGRGLKCDALSSFFSSNYIQTMASLLSGATKTAHHLATSLLSAAEAKVGSTIPVKVPVKEDDAEKTFTFQGIKGKNVFVRL